VTAARNLEQAREHLQAGRLDAAMAATQRALAADPENVDAMLLTGRILRRRHRYDIAAQIYETILGYVPGSAEAEAGLGACHGAMRRYFEAVPPLRRAVALKPDYYEAWSFLGEALIEQGATREALDCFERSHAIRPFNSVVLSKYLFHAAFDPRYDEARICGLNRDWGERVEAAVEPLTPPAWPAHRRLRIGYLSDEFREGVTARFMEPVFARHDRQGFEVFRYARNVETDATTGRLSKGAEAWRDLSGLTDAEAAVRIRQDEVDILMLCTSYRAESRVLMVYRPAPVQVCYANRVSTTGLRSVDYLIAEDAAEPPGSDSFHAERLVRMTRANVYTPPAGVAPPGPPPCIRSGTVTFASFNHLGKLTDDVIAVWSRVLYAVPGSRLVLKSVDRFADAGTRQNFLERFAGHGIGGDRLELLTGDANLAAHLDRYRQVDIALDPFPCNGGTTTCEALWMGVPVVTIRGNTFMGRQGSTFLGHVGLDDLVAATREEYVAVAQRLASDHEKLARLRNDLRDEVASKLLDPVSHVRELETAYREMWRIREAGAEPAAFAVSGGAVRPAAE
jgi:protein O-GlcNAc transferase